MQTAERTLYPMMVDLAGRHCVVLGCGTVAERKVTSLLSCGAQVEVISPDVTPRLQQLTREGRIRWQPRHAAQADVTSAFLLFVATNDREVNREMAGAASAGGKLVNVADDPRASTFHVPAVLRRGDLTIGIATGGGSPALARRLRLRLEQVVGPEYEAFLAALQRLRERTQALIADPEARQAVYRRALDSDLFDLAASQDAAGVDARIAALLESVDSQAR